MVYPSGFTFEKYSSPISPFAPARFSIITGCPNLSLRIGEIVRPNVSDVPPGPIGIMMVIGLFGYEVDCA